MPSDEERFAPMDLKIGHRLGYRRLRDVDGLGCLGRAAMARCGDEILQLAQVNVNQFFEFKRYEMNIFY